MALTGTDRGTGTHNTGATSFTLTPGSNFTAGAIAVLCVAADNSASGGSSNNFTTITDTLGNNWTKAQSPLFDNGAASAGVQGVIAISYMHGGTLTTGTTITVNFADSTTAKTWTLMEVTAAAGFTPRYITGAANAGQSGSSAPTVTTGTIQVGNMTIAMCAMEAGTTQTFTDDADATNGSWSASQYNEVGTTTTGSAIGTQRKVQTTTASTQTFNPTLGLTCDNQCTWIQIAEVPRNGPGSF